jgi:hyperosmotically inducible periplasmic protein
MASEGCATERPRAGDRWTLSTANEETIMKTNVVLSCVVACALAGLVPVSAAADPATEMSGAEAKVVIKDSAITSSIKARLATDQVGGFKHIRVDTDDRGIVTLKGHARTQEAADRAISITRNTEGVREVRSAIEIKIDD